MAKQKVPTQIEKFKQAARELEADDDEKHFNEKLDKIARQQPAPKPSKKAAAKEQQCVALSA